ncbi:MAG: S-adenosylmethionine:tRNA ribosyltransferase-isomerase [Longimicrobiales bacterium]
MSSALHRMHVRPWGRGREVGHSDSLAALPAFDFTLPDALAAHEPPEMRGLARDAVRLLVSHGDRQITHARFRSLPRFLARGDVLVVNTSATINAAFRARRCGGPGRCDEQVAVHLSTPLPDGRWVIEMRRPTAHGSDPLLDARAGERLLLPAVATATLIEPYAPTGHSAPHADRVRLWIASITTSNGVMPLAERYGEPIRYAYVPRRWPLAYYQTMFAAEPGSAEMPSAGRPFTHAILETLSQNGVRIVPIVLHTGVSSLESDEPPYPERFRVPAATADAVNEAHATRRRVVAVGTTAVRAIETMATPAGIVSPGEGWTNLTISPERGVFAVDALLTGFHPPHTSHLALLEALAGTPTIAHAYATALRHRYLWHEFGDSHLVAFRTCGNDG